MAGRHDVEERGDDRADLLDARERRGREGVDLAQLHDRLGGSGAFAEADEAWDARVAGEDLQAASRLGDAPPRHVALAHERLAALAGLEHGELARRARVDQDLRAGLADR